MRQSQTGETPVMAFNFKPIYYEYKRRSKNTSYRVY